MSDIDFPALISAGYFVQNNYGYWTVEIDRRNVSTSSLPSVKTQAEGWVLAWEHFQESKTT